MVWYFETGTKPTAPEIWAFSLQEDKNVLISPYIASRLATNFHESQSHPVKYGHLALVY